MWGLVTGVGVGLSVCVGVGNLLVLVTVVVWCDESRVVVTDIVLVGVSGVCTSRVTIS